MQTLLLADAAGSSLSRLGLLSLTLLTIVLLVLLITWIRLHAFIAMAIAALFIGLLAGLDPATVAQVFQQGLGDVLGSIAMVIALGTVLGRLLVESGGAQCIASTITGLTQPRWLPWTVLLAAFIIGTPVFFAVGLVLLAPIVYSLSRSARLPLLALGIPLVAALSVTHGLVPPHPGPIAAIGILKADFGRTILYSLLVGIPTAIVAGPLFGCFATRFAASAPAGDLLDKLTSPPTPRRAPSFGLTLLTILLPVLLMIGSSFLPYMIPKEAVGLLSWGKLVGHPTVAMLAAVLLGLYTLGFRAGFNRVALLQFATDSLAPIASVILIIGAGGGFSRVLVTCGVDEAVESLAAEWSLPPLVLGWLVAALIRVATGSATVAVTAAAGVMFSAAAGPEVNVELLVVAMGAGSLVLSHVNDGGFWLVKEYLNLSIVDTLKTWTVLETIASVVALAIVLLLDIFI